MNWLIALLLMFVAFWQATSGSGVHLATATLAISGAWFVSLWTTD